MPSDYARNVVQCKLADLAGSPPELILGVAIFCQLAHLYDGWRCWVYSEWEFQTFAVSNEQHGDAFVLVVLVPQLNVPGVGRVDFAVFVPQISTCEPLVIVECDGHAYHERTPDQAREDNRRDRELQRLRLPLLRFTASDVVRDNAGVAHEIALFVNEKCHEKTELRAAEAERDELLRENYLYRLGMPVC